MVCMERERSKKRINKWTTHFWILLSWYAKYKEREFDLCEILLGTRG